jgi:tRNA 2-thiouridine synthesizing protein A
MATSYLTVTTSNYKDLYILTYIWFCAVMVKPRNNWIGEKMDSDATLDCLGLSCPMPIVKLAQKMKGLNAGQVLELLADDIGAKEDVPAWCKRTGNELLDSVEGEVLKFYIRKK